MSDFIKNNRAMLIMFALYLAVGAAFIVYFEVKSNSTNYTLQGEAAQLHQLSRDLEAVLVELSNRITELAYIDVDTMVTPVPGL